MRRERPPKLTRTAFLRGLRALAENDSHLSRVLDTLGTPPMWSRPPGFATMVYVILEQQVSLASAKEVLGLTKRPTASELEAIGERWPPWRAVAARILWHAYLCKREGSGPRAM